MSDLARFAWGVKVQRQEKDKEREQGSNDGLDSASFPYRRTAQHGFQISHPAS
jgi:hypothetical protein